eukprot:CFRG4878T1
MSHDLILQQFMEVTGDCRVPQILSLLQGQNWDLQGAVELYMIGGLSDIWDDDTKDESQSTPTDTARPHSPTIVRPIPNDDVRVTLNVKWVDDTLTLRDLQPAQTTVKDVKSLLENLTKLDITRQSLFNDTILDPPDILTLSELNLGPATTLLLVDKGEDTVEDASSCLSTGSVAGENRFEALRNRTNGVQIISSDSEKDVDGK